MRLAFWILVVLNLILLAGTQGLFGAHDAGREPGRIGQQIKPEELRSVPAVVAADAPARPVAPSPAAPPPQPEFACKHIDGLMPAEADSLIKAIGDLPDWQARLLAVDTPTPYWVAIPGLASRAAAEKKRDEVALLGISEHEIVETASAGPFAVSFARLPDEKAANDMLQGLQRKGVRSARAIPQPAEQRKSVEMRAPAVILNQKLPELAALFPAASVGDCAAP